MTNYEIVEEYDGRLPLFNIVKDGNVVKSFDTFKEAEHYLNELVSTPCGEEDPCN